MHDDHASRSGHHPGQGTPPGDHDQPYHFGRQPRASQPYPFSIRQYARLLILRGRVRDSLRHPACDEGQAA